MKIIVNTDVHSTERDSELLVDYLRKEQHMVGTKIGCREGDCGACTVILGKKENGRIVYKPIVSCLTTLSTVADKHVITIEGLNIDNGLTLIQEKFINYNATQCGFCTPGFILSITAYLLEPIIEINGALSAIDGNICRCTGYLSIIRAIEDIVHTLETAGINATTGKARVEFLIKNKVLPPTFMNGYKLLEATESESITNLRDSKSKFDLVLAGGTKATSN